MLFTAAVMLGRAVHEDECQQGEDQRLDNTHEQFQPEERQICHLKDITHDEQQNHAGEHITEKTEGERDDL